MKTIFIISFFCLLFEISCYGQIPYSVENLQQSSPEQLDSYLDFAKKQKKTGARIKTLGLLAFGTGVLVYSVSDHDQWIISRGEAIGGVTALLGASATLVGLSIQLTNSARVKRINRVMSQSSRGFKLDFSPFSFRSNIVEKYQYGATIKIRF